MPIPLPNLDDHGFDDLTAEARALIPVLYPDWTDHNPGDPGIVLVELLAWLTEMQLFQVNQIPEAHTRKFLELLGGPQFPPQATGGLDAAVRQTMRGLHERYRAVTPADYEYLVRETWPGSPEAARLTPARLAAVRRVLCVPGRNLTAADPTAPVPAHVSVVVVPEPGSAEDRQPRPTEALTTALHRFLAPRRILTVRHHVVGPQYVDIGVSANLALHEDSLPEAALDDARNRLLEFFHPLHGGAAREGWPFGQGVYPSQVYAVLEQSNLIDYIEDVRISGPGPGTAAGIELDVHQLVRLARIDLVGYDSYGRTHPRNWGGPS
jgi:hypothetical protein